VTRQAAVAFLARFAGEPDAEDDLDPPALTDVTASHPFYDEIAWAVDAGIVEGYPDATFRSGNPVTRQAAMAFLFREAAWQRTEDVRHNWETAPH
jgi:hypothetical protein